MILEIVVSIALMLGAIFSKQLKELGLGRGQWNFENEKLENTISIIGRIIIFILGLWSLIYFLFFKR